MAISKNLILGLFCLCFSSCNNTGDKNVSSNRISREDLSDINTYLVEKDRERIINYIERKGLKMQESPTGLWYKIEKEGNGDFFKDEDRIAMEYTCSLLDGTLCYSSEKLGMKQVLLGKGELEAGLNEGLRMLKPGGEATFIIPPYLAYGLLGDDKAIPSRATIVYEIRISKTE